MTSELDKTFKSNAHLTASTEEQRGVGINNISIIPSCFHNNRTNEFVPYCVIEINLIAITSLHVCMDR